MNKEHDYITSDEDYDNQDDVIQIDSNKERFALFNISAQILDKNNIRDTKFEENELKHIDSIKFRDCVNENDKFGMVLQASTNIPAGTRLTVAKEQINCYADQINRTIKNN